MASVYDKTKLSNRQMMAVADERWDDAMKLRDAERWNGAIYLAGISVECILKALLIERHPNLKSANAADLSESDHHVHSLIYRSHDLDGMLVQLRPEVQVKLKALANASAYRRFEDACSEWSFRVRYSPKKSNKDIATRFVEIIEEVRQWLKQL